MRLRMMAMHGPPSGLALAGAPIEPVGFAVTTTLNRAIGIVATLVVTWYWRNALWAHGAPANRE